MNTIREKPHRLPDEHYAGGTTISFTATLQRRVTAFTNRSIINELTAFLLEAVQNYGCRLLVYVFMPDHLHAILSSKDERGDPLSAMKRFKQRSAFWLARYRSGIQWQKGFYDHVLRTEQDLMRHVRYALENPMRAGIVHHWKEYPYRGSTVYDIDTWEDDVQQVDVSG